MIIGVPIQATFLDQKYAPYLYSILNFCFLEEKNNLQLKDTS